MVDETLRRTAEFSTCSTNTRPDNTQRALPLPGSPLVEPHPCKRLSVRLFVCLVVDLPSFLGLDVS